MTLIRWLFAVALLAIVPTPASSQGGDPGDATGEQDVQASRREAVKYLEGLHVAQLRAQDATGRFAPLHDLSRLPALPVGFVPKLLADQYSYVVSVTDLFDSCDSALFIDDRGVVYIGQPWPTAGANRSGDDGSAPTVSQQPELATAPDAATYSRRAVPRSVERRSMASHYGGLPLLAMAVLAG